ncbi:MAG TPA: hypothetical protein VHX38_14880 [Pseudonocardiaceae bacterium]|jgi:hypothetical protein|nr:hypothetical protein [Pseudonocardiaceae bacterium]
MASPARGASEVTVAEAAGVGIDGAERPTEDRVRVLPNAVILLDGATALRPQRHSGGWYAERLSAELAARLRAEPTIDLADLLAGCIAALAAEHDLVPGAAPSSTVALLRWTDTEVDGLVLADSPIVAFTDDGPRLLADDRIATLPRPGGYRARLAEGGGFGAEHITALRSAGSTTGRLRNVEGGFWVAEADPAAAARARRASWPRTGLRAVLLASDGVSCGVDDYHLFDWPAVLAMAEADGPQAVLDAVRAAERQDPDGERWPRPKRHDDQALALVTFR